MTTYLIPTTPDQWEALLALDNETDVHSHIRCRVCGESELIAYYIEHKEGCLAAAAIALAIENLPPEEKARRVEMERYL